MSRITMELANTISKSLAIKKKEKQDEADKAVTEFVRSSYLNTLPDEVVAFWNKYPRYTECNSYIQVRTEGNGYFGISVSRVPSIGGNTINATFNKSDSEKLYKLRKLQEDTKEEYEKLVTDIYNALLQLRTYKNIQEKFPEAAKYFPIQKDSNLLPAINIDKIRKQLLVAVAVFCVLFVSA